jgi:hypothetical protein
MILKFEYYFIELQAFFLGSLSFRKNIKNLIVVSKAIFRVKVE